MQAALIVWLLTSSLVMVNGMTIQQLRDFLSERLPAYTIPSTMVLLDAMPLTPNGKVDRKALLARELERSQATSNMLLRARRAEKLLPESGRRFSASIVLE